MLMKCKYIIITIALLVCAISCEDGLDRRWNIEGENGFNIFASAPSQYQKTRVGGEVSHFIDSTKFYLYATEYLEDGTEGWGINYLLKNYNKFESGSKDHLAIAMANEDVMRGNNEVRMEGFISKNYGDMYAIADKFPDNAKKINFYGMVIASNTQEERRYLENSQREKYQFIREAGKPAALKVSYHEIDDATQTTNIVPLPDLMWSDSLKNYSAFDKSGDIRMPFKHVLSQLRFYATSLDEDMAEIKITSLKLTDYDGGIVSMKDGLFEYDLNGDGVISGRKETITIGEDLDYVVPRTSPDKDNPFAVSRIFPTAHTTYDNKYIAKAAVPDDHAVNITVGISVDGDSEKLLSAPLKLANENFAFAPNHYYEIVLSLTAETVVMTVQPLYYEYVSEPTILDEYEVGEPIDFGGILWAAENLGATSSNPTANAEAWERARGFYFQYGRNIPYYVRGSVLDPYPEASGSNTWDKESIQYLYSTLPEGKDKNINIPSGAEAKGYYDEAGHGARAYPYIPALWEHEIEKSNGNKNTGYTNFLKNYIFYSSKLPDPGTGQTNPSKNFSDPYIANYIITGDYAPSSVAFTTYIKDNGNYLKARYWNKKQTVPKNWSDASGNNESDPCPKGWRLPTMDEFLSIFPYDHCCGDISFNPAIDGSNDACAFGNYAKPNKTFNHSGSDSFVETVAAKASNGDYNGQASVYVGIYKDGKGYNNLLSQIADKAGKVSQYKEGWGTIYCIKCAGTPNAYAVRWQIEIVGYNPITKQAEAGINPPHQETGAQPFLGRGVLVISKYELGTNKEDIYLSKRALTTAEKAAYSHLDASIRPENKCVAFTNADNNLAWNNYVQGTSKEVNIDWDHPDGILYIPIPGYVIANSGGSQALLYPGREALFWSSNNGVSNANGDFATAVRVKFSGSYESRFLYSTREEYIANGCNIRCVRDTRAEIK